MRDEGVRCEEVKDEGLSEGMRGEGVRCEEVRG